MIVFIPGLRGTTESSMNVHLVLKHYVDFLPSPGLGRSEGKVSVLLEIISLLLERVNNISEH